MTERTELCADIPHDVDNCFFAFFFSLCLPLWKKSVTAVGERSRLKDKQHQNGIHFLPPEKIITSQTNIFKQWQ